MKAWLIAPLVAIGLIGIGEGLRRYWRRRSMREFEDPTRLDLFRRHPEWKKED